MNSPSIPDEMFDPTPESIAGHRLPSWFDDAKLGVFLHWGLYSVPAWAPQVPDIQTMLRTHDPRYLLAHNPYAEWYLNTMRIPGSPTAQHHAEVYGDAPYENFRDEFDEGSTGADLDALAGLCRQSGARYVVLTTKHHDAFCLWPTDVAHPTMGAYHSRRDLVGDLSTAVRDAGLRMGLYYSTGYDWPFNDVVLDRLANVVLGVPQTPDYVAYVQAHLHELIDRYDPSVLWSDIGAPVGLDLPALFARYYNAVPDGVVNDRWTQGSGRSVGAATRAIVKAGGATVQALWRFIPEKRKTLVVTSHDHHDFTTPEYTQHDQIVEQKWESTRGVGHSFGANRDERPEDILTTPGLVRSFVDIVAKNGNLLIGVGPMPDGRIPEWQAAPLVGLGEWLEINGDAIYGTRPWSIPVARTSDGTDVRFTRKGDDLFVTLLEVPATRRFELWGIDVDDDIEGVEILGLGGSAAGAFSWSVNDGTLSVELPDRLPVTPALVLRLPASGAMPSGPADH